MEKLKISGLWKNEDRNGNAYYAGSLRPGVRIMIFKNTFKDSEREPDAILYLAPSDRQNDNADSADSADSARSAPEAAKAAAPESLPF